MSLHLEGLWTRYEDPEPVLDEIASLPEGKATPRLQEIYAEPIKPDLIGQRIAEIKEAGVTCAVAVTPHRTLELADAVLRAEPDLLVIQATIVRAEHVARTVEPLNLKAFIRHYELPVLVGGCTSYQAALHLMRTGAAGVLVGAGSGAAAIARQVLGVGVAARHRAGRRPGRPACATWRRPASTARSSPTAASTPGATSPGPWPAAPTP